MARLKVSENETAEQRKERLIFETISNFANRSEKTSWKRKRDNIEALIEKLKPLEQQILDITAQKLPIMDEIATIRNDMVEGCVHPYDMLTIHENQVVCKFCEKKMSIPNVNE